MEHHITSKGGFSHWGVIWCEVMIQIKSWEREWTDGVPLSFCICKKENDREISEWYNEVKLGRQIRICRE